MKSVLFIRLILLFPFSFFLTKSFTQETNSIAMEHLSKHPIKNLVINQLQYFYIEKGKGETIFFLHGFPDLAGTWDEAIDSLSKDYHCVAPFLRGYYPTAIPKDGNYAPQIIAKDIHELAKAMGVSSYYVVGQDWGASVVYSMMNLYSSNIIKAVTIAIPHPSTISRNPVTLWKARHFIRFRNKKKSIAYTKSNNYAYLDRLYKRWSPNWTDYQSTANLIKQSYDLDGRLEAAIGYYWTFHNTLKDKELQAFYNQVVDLPLLTMIGKTDGALLAKSFTKMKKNMPPSFKLLSHETAGHFLHQEAPAFFLSSLTEFFARTE